LDTSDIFVLYEIDYDDNFPVSRVNFPSKPPPQKKKQRSESICASSEEELQEAVDKCDKGTHETSCQIDVCQTRIEIAQRPDPLFRRLATNGIDVTNKNILFSCQNQCPTQRCILDGLGTSRILYGENSNITFQNFILANGYDADEGGAIKLVNNSIVTLSNCSFWNNNAPFGSAISVENANLIIDGVETSIVNNSGIGLPIKVVRSIFNLSHTVFGVTEVSLYGNAILMLASTINVVNVTSVTVADKATSDDCDVYIYVFSEDLNVDSSCVNFENRTDVAFPIIDFGCTTQQPSVSVAPSKCLRLHQHHDQAYQWPHHKCLRLHQRNDQAYQWPHQKYQRLQQKLQHSYL
jgi:hypothetical protein